jgi:hypothetical protein
MKRRNLGVPEPIGRRWFRICLEEQATPAFKQMWANIQTSVNERREMI